MRFSIYLLLVLVCMVWSLSSALAEGLIEPVQDTRIVDYRSLETEAETPTETPTVTPTYTPSPTNTPKPTNTPNVLKSLPLNYSSLNLEIPAFSMTKHPITGEVYVYSFTQKPFTQIYSSRLFRIGEQIEEIELKNPGHESLAFYRSDYSDVTMTTEGHLFFITDKKLYKLNPFQPDEPIKEFNITGSKIHYVSRHDNIPIAEPGDLLILQHATNGYYDQDDTWHSQGKRFNKLIRVSWDGENPIVETVIPSDKFLRGSNISDMGIGPEGRLFFLTDLQSKFYTLNQVGKIEEFFHQIFPFTLSQTFIYNSLLDSFFVIGHEKHSYFGDVYRIDVKEQSWEKFTTIGIYQYYSLESSSDEQSLYLSHTHKSHTSQRDISRLYQIKTLDPIPETPTVTPTPLVPTPTPTPINAWFVLDGFGGIHTTNTDVKPPVLPYFWDFNIVRDIEPDPNGNGWYMLDGYGGIHRSSETLPMTTELPYFGFDIARNLEIKLDDEGNYLFYLLDGFGVVHTNDETFSFGAFPWLGTDVMRDLEPDPNGDGWLVMDERGLIYSNTEWKVDGIRFDHRSRIMRGLVRFEDERTVMIDFWGGRHTNKYYPVVDKVEGLPDGFYFPGWDIIWDVEVVPYPKDHETNE